MGFDAFIRMDGIEGESTDDGHLGWIEMLRYVFGIKQTFYSAPVSAGGFGAERADFSDFVFRKQDVYNECSNEEHIQVLKSQQVDYFKAKILNEEFHVFQGTSRISSF